MLTHNSYLDYKRSTTYLTYWLCHASNTVIRSLTNEQKDDLAATVNTTGQVTCRELVTMAEHVASNLREEVPSTIFRLFRSVIKARSKAFDMYQELAAAEADKEMEQSNITHKHFIDTLDVAFTILGGKAWMAKQRANDEELEDQETIERVVFTNPFSELATDLSIYVPSDDDEVLQSTGPHAQKSLRKGKRSQKEKRKKIKPQPTTASKEAELGDIPLESYRILDGPEGLITDYYIAVCSVLDEWRELRAYIHDQWRLIAYEELNSAIAGTMANLAISMVKRTASAVFVEFPSERDTYALVLRTFTRGMSKKAHDASTPCSNLDERVVEPEEALSMYAYQDLHDFIVDYQKNRNGKPTKRMQAALATWDPNLNLVQVSKTERITWRRSYTINWLYDLVNIHVHNVLTENDIPVRDRNLETIQWSFLDGKYRMSRLLGIEDFAEAITSLAMQKQSTRPGDGILLWHVFQLQCIVDSTTVSRGWSFSANGHVLKSLLEQHCPRRDIDAFMSDTDVFTEGLVWGIRALLGCFERDATSYGHPERYQNERDMLERLASHFQEWLGNCKKVFESTGMPSRFSKHNANGLWEYSPFLCGVGLMEALELTYRLSMIIWDCTREPIAFLHLHNMALKEGYTKYGDAPVFEQIEDSFSTSLFLQGQAPETEFYQAYIKLMGTTRTTVRHAASKRAEIRQFFKVADDSHNALSLKFNRYFRQKTNLLLYREAGWNLERIPESETHPHTVLGMIRIAQTKRVVDPTTGNKTFDKTDLIMRAIAQGSDDESLMRNFRTLRIIQTEEGDEPPRVGELAFSQNPKPEGCPASTKRFGDADGDGYAPSGLELLTMVWHDVCRDIGGCRPPLGINYPWFTARILVCFVEWESFLKEAQNPLYLDVYVRTQAPQGDRRIALTKRILLKRRGYEECLELLVKVIIQLGPDLLEHIYWSTSSILKGQRCCPVSGPQDAISPFLMSDYAIQKLRDSEPETHKEKVKNNEDKTEDDRVKENREDDSKKTK